MLNNVVLVGRLIASVELTEDDKERKNAKIVLAIPRPYKNDNGEYDTDFIECVLYNGIAQNTAEYCKKGDLIGIKGRIQGVDGKMIIIAEKVTFLSSKQEKEED